MDTISAGLRGAQKFYFHSGAVDGGSLAQGREDAAGLGMESWKKDAEDGALKFGIHTREIPSRSS